MAIDGTRLWKFRFLTLGICQNVLFMGVRSIWYTVVISNAISSVILFILYKAVIWKKAKIRIEGKQNEKEKCTTEK